MVEGLLNLNKRSGVSSRRAVDEVARLLGKVKVGHTGTLDPLAEGVLVLCVGGATRLVEYVQQSLKEYRAEFLLGQSSDTDDIEGEVQILTEPPVPKLEEVMASADRLVGSIMQRPPAYSAIKVDGQRAYRLARQGKPPEMVPREVVVESIEVVEYAYPRLALEICCHGGTYIRAIGRDLAQSLGTAAVMSSLVRTAVGPFKLSASVAIGDLTNEQSVREHLEPPSRAFDSYVGVELSVEDLARIGHGQDVELSKDVAARAKNGELLARDSEGIPRAILIRRDGNWGPKRVFRWSE